MEVKIMIKGNDKLKNCKFIDLFAGIGGFRLALESFGAKCVYSSEWDNDAQNTYEQNFGERPQGDITKVDEKTIPNHEILCAGFPCQPFSISGKKLGFEDSRGTLFFDVARIVKEKKPKVVFMENVKNFETHDNGKTLQVVKATMEELKYDFYFKVLDASDYGVPQKRERIYMIAISKDVPHKEFKFPKPIKCGVHVEDIIDNSIGLDSKLYKCKYVYQIEKEDINYANKPIRLGIVNKGGQGDRIYSTKGIAITLSAQGGGTFNKTGGYLINGKARRLSIRECARLMGFPDKYIPCNKEGQAYKQFGNSVVVNVLQYIVQEIITCLEIE